MAKEDKPPPKKGLPSLLKTVGKAHPAVRVIDTLNTLKSLTPSDKEFEEITERVSSENQDLINKVLEIIVPDYSSEKDVDLDAYYNKGLRQFAKKQIGKAVNPKNLSTIVNEEGLPTLLYHATASPKQFSEFDLTIPGWRGKQLEKPYQFLSTSTDRTGVQRWHPKGREKTKEEYIQEYLDGDMPFESEETFAEGARTIPGMRRVEKIFDYRNPDHIKELKEDDLERYKKRLEDVRKNPSYPVTLEEVKKEYSKKTHPHFGKEDYKRILNNNKSNHKVLIDSYLKNIEGIKNEAPYHELKKGYFTHIEPRVQQLKDLGFDAFTTQESGFNIMLTDPKEQFVPLFDPERKGKIGKYTKGGVIRNPNGDYSPRDI